MEENRKTDAPISAALLGVIRTHMRHESRIVRRHGGMGAFIPSYRTYTRDDVALLMAKARSNGGILPISIHAALMEGGTGNPNGSWSLKPKPVLTIDLITQEAAAVKATKPE